MRCAKFGQGTNSYFIWMPVLAVKSLDSSTSALAGSQAAQHSVNVFCCAFAPRLVNAVAANTLAASATLLFRKLMRVSCSMWKRGKAACGLGDGTCRPWPSDRAPDNLMGHD